MKPAELSLDALGKAVGRLPDDALAPIRSAALARLKAHGLPSSHHEDWKYTDLSTAIDISNRWLESGAGYPTDTGIDVAVDAITAEMPANWLIIANGVVDTSRFNACQAVTVQRFSDSTAPQVADRPLAELNAALLLDGLQIRIEAQAAEPIGLLVLDTAPAAATISQASIDIDIAAGASAEFVEYQVSSGDGEHYSNSMVTLRLAEAATAAYARIQNRSLRHVQTAAMNVALEKDATLRLSGFDAGGRLVRNDLEVDLAGTGAQVEFDGVYLAGDGQHIDNHTRVDHRVGPARSRQEYRGILNGNCRCVWNGKAIVHEGADGTDAQQANHNLLLSEKAEIDAKPELEIYADDVKCSHGTTVGQLDEQALFYLRSRGIDEASAKRMLTQAFATGLVNRVPVEAARTKAADLVAARLLELVGAATK